MNAADGSVRMIFAEQLLVDLCGRNFGVQLVSSAGWEFYSSQKGHIDRLFHADYLDEVEPADQGHIAQPENSSFFINGAAGGRQLGDMKIAVNKRRIQA